MLNRNVLLLCGLLLPVLNGCGPANDSSIVFLNEGSNRYAESDEQYIKMLSFEDNTHLRQTGTKKIEPKASLKVVRKLIRRLQSQRASDIFNAESALMNLADPTKHNPMGAKVRIDALNDLVALLDHTRIETRSAAIRLIVRCYTSRKTRKYIYHVIQKFNDPMPEVRFAAWYALTGQYGTIVKNEYKNMSKKERSRYTKRWMKWYRKTISRNYEGKLPKHD